MTGSCSRGRAGARSSPHRHTSAAKTGRAGGRGDCVILDAVLDKMLGPPFGSSARRGPSAHPPRRGQVAGTLLLPAAARLELPGMWLTPLLTDPSEAK